MNYRKVKKNGDNLSVLGYGCMRFPKKLGKIDEKRAEYQVLHSIEKGVNYFDTAMPYHLGDSEPFLGKVLSKGKRDRVKIATKLPPWSVKTREDMDRILNSQLVRLKTDRIDYYLLHALQDENWKRLKNLGVLDFLDKAKKEGKIINSGFSFHGNKDSFKEIVDAYDWEICQIQYNYLDVNRQAGIEGLKYAASKDLGVIVMEPLRGGSLAGKVPKPIQEIWDRADVKRSAAEWAFRWIWNHPEVTVVLSGMNEEEHIDENLKVADEAFPGSLTDNELSLMKKAADKFHELMKIGCTGCGYCLPCPAGVDIPLCFELYNRKNMFGDWWHAKVFYMSWVAGFTSNKRAYASLCKNCGKCVEKCPQNLPIPKYLKEVAKEFDGIDLKIMLWVADNLNRIVSQNAYQKTERRKQDD